MSAQPLPEEEKVRRAGHVVLDAVTASTVTPAGDHDPVDLAFSHLLEIDAISLSVSESAEVDDDGETAGELELDISPLMGGVMLVVRRLVAELAARDGVDEAQVVMSIRSALDHAAG
ncbi:hypothetical protein [Nocardioides acrostichi]|uniref:Uncharacterized protein n=1 Tax=Nocardioides acrostichi TaxID=2784339 RepID=A0A930V5S0_9ACTN|nr:hypothetical protein [Nocardioides acrostichi]MBF4163684.1 hypothetical protein [Nocardioides acrostichi]